jgi:hypothetical protein
MGNSNQGSTQSSGSQQPQVPAFLEPYYGKTVKDLLAGMQNLPNISSLYSGTPLQGTAPIGSGTYSDINQLQQAAAGGNNAATAAGQQGLQNFIGTGANGPSAATQAEINQFDTLQAPLLDSQAALMGQGNSGALLSALAQGQESALVPFLQQDQTNQLQAAGALGSLGQQEAATQQGQLGNALTASQLPQQNTQAQLDALFNQANQQWNFASGIQTGAQSQFPSLIGQAAQSGSTTSAPKF